MHKFVGNQRVLVRRTENDEVFSPPEPGTVSRIRIRDDSAFIDLDIGRRVAAYPDDCDPMEVKDAVAISAVAPARFGRDHHSTLLYIESRCVDHRGTVDFRNLRTNRVRHPGRYADMAWDTKYGTRLADGTVLPEHDDHDCIDDMIACGWIENRGTAVNPVYILTDLGWGAAGRLRREHAERMQSTG